MVYTISLVMAQIVASYMQVKSSEGPQSIKFTT